MRRLALLLLCWAAFVYAGDATMPGDRGRIRPPIRLPTQFFNRMRDSGPAPVDPMYAAGMVAALSTSTMQLVNNQMVLAPFVSSRSGTVMRALSAVLQAAPVGQPHTNFGASVGVVCRMTIYDSYDAEAQMYPHHLQFTTASQTPGGGQCNAGANVGQACASDDTVACPGATCPGCCQTVYSCETGARTGLACSTDDTNATTGCGAGATCPGCCMVKSGFVNNFSLGKGGFTGGFPADGVDMTFVVAPERAYWFGLQCGGAGGSQLPWVKCLNALGTWAVAMDSFLSAPWNVVRKTQGGVSSPDPFPVTPTTGALGIQFVQLPCMPLMAARMGQ